MIVSVVINIGTHAHGLNVLILSIHICAMTVRAIIATAMVVVRLSTVAIALPLYPGTGNNVHIPDLVHCWKRPLELCHPQQRHLHQNPTDMFRHLITDPMIVAHTQLRGMTNLL